MRISWSQIRRLMACPAQYDYAYAGTRLGYALEPIEELPRMTLGKVWGMTMQTYHQDGDRAAANIVLEGALTEVKGILGLVEDGEKMMDDLRLAFREYAFLQKPLGLSRIEERFERAIPGYPDFRFMAQIDGMYQGQTSRNIIDFKLRTKDQFMTDGDAARSLQARLYAWAVRGAFPGEQIGVTYHESHAHRVTPIQINADGRPSKRQSCSLIEYLGWHAARGLDPDLAVVEKLKTRGAVAFKMTEADLYEDDDAITSFLRSIVLHLTLFKIPSYQAPRFVSPMHCRTCAFLPICDDPHADPDAINNLYRKKEAMVRRNPPVSTLVRPRVTAGVSATISPRT